MYLFAWVASCRWRARVTRVFVIRGGVARAAPAVAEISLSAWRWRGWELKKALSGPFHSRVRGHRVRGRWCRGARHGRV